MEATPLVDAGIDALIERRSREAERFDALDGARRQAERARMAARWEWIRHHRYLAELHLRLSEEHEAKAKLLEPTEGGDEA